MKSKHLTLLTIAAAIASFSLTQVTQGAPPELPHLFFGTVEINDSGAPTGTTIVARIDGVEKGRITTTTVGKYGGPSGFEPKLLVQSGVPSGSIINFLIDSNIGQQTALFTSGNIDELNLTFAIQTPAPTATSEPTSAPASEIPTTDQTSSSDTTSTAETTATPTSIEQEPTPTTNETTPTPTPVEQTPTPSPIAQQPPSTPTADEEPAPTTQPTPTIPPLQGLIPIPTPEPLAVPIVAIPSPEPTTTLTPFSFTDLTPQSIIEQVPLPARSGLTRLLPIAGIFGEEDEEIFTDQIPTDSKENQPLVFGDSEETSKLENNQTSLMAAIGNILTLGTNNTAVAVAVLLTVLGGLGYGLYSLGVIKKRG